MKTELAKKEIIPMYLAQIMAIIKRANTLENMPADIKIKIILNSLGS